MLFDSEDDLEDVVVAGIDDDAEAAFDELDDPDFVANFAQVLLVPLVLVDQGRDAFPEFRFVIQVLKEWATASDPGSFA